MTVTVTAAGSLSAPSYENATTRPDLSGEGEGERLNVLRKLSIADRIGLLRLSFSASGI